MYKIVRKKELNSAVTLMEIEAPFIAKKAKAGQFIIFRIDEMGERVPLTIAGYDREKGTVTIIFQKVGFSTIALGNLNEGDYPRTPKKQKEETNHLLLSLCFSRSLVPPKSKKKKLIVCLTNRLTKHKKEEYYEKNIQS